MQEHDLYGKGDRKKLLFEAIQIKNRQTLTIDPIIVFKLASMGTWN